MEDEYCSITDIASIIGITRQAVWRQIQQDKVPFVEENGRGGNRKMFRIASLRKAWRIRIYAHRSKDVAEKASPVPRDKSLIVADSMAVEPSNGACGKSRGIALHEIDRAAAKARLVALYVKHIEENSGWGGKVTARESFVRAYNMGENGRYPALYRLVGPISWKTLDRYAAIVSRETEKPLEEREIFCLADKRGKHCKGDFFIRGRAARIIEAELLRPNAPLIAEVIRNAKARMKAEGIPLVNPCTGKVISDHTFRRHIERYKVENYDKWVAFREGEKALNEKCVFHIQRDYDRIDVGDVLFCDGHNWNLEWLNPFTGKACRGTLVTWFDMKSNYPVGFDISPTENTQAIATALYRAILRLGKMPKVAYLDNGKAFRSKYFNGVEDFKAHPVAGLFTMLGMDKIFAWSYHGESKTVERWHRDLGELERAMSSYVGTSIERKPPRMKRGERFHRELYDALTDGRPPTLEALYRAFADWIDYHSRRPQRGHLRGKSPLEAFEEGRGPGISPEEQIRLRFLMMATQVKAIPRDGFKMPWCDERYYHPDLYGRRRQAAIVRYDWFDKSKIYVYDTGNQFICEAVPMSKTHPAARPLGSEEDLDELGAQIDLKRSQVKRTMGPARKFLETVVMPEVKRRREIAEASVEDGREGRSGSPVLRVVEKRAALPEPSMSEEEKERVLREFEELQALQSNTYEQDIEEEGAIDVDFMEIDPSLQREPIIWDILPAMPDMDRYEKDIELQAQGMLMPKMEQAWMCYFEKTPLYKLNESYYDQYRVKMALMYQQSK